MFFAQQSLRDRGRSHTLAGFDKLDPLSNRSGLPRDPPDIDARLILPTLMSEFKKGTSLSPFMARIERADLISVYIKVG